MVWATLERGAGPGSGAGQPERPETRFSGQILTLSLAQRAGYLFFLPPLPKECIEGKILYKTRGLLRVH